MRLVKLRSVGKLALGNREQAGNRAEGANVFVIKEIDKQSNWESFISACECDTASVDCNDDGFVYSCIRSSQSIATIL